MIVEPIETKRDPVVDEYHGERVVDPYRWLEGDGPEVDRWTDRQNERTRRYLGTATGRERLERRFGQLAAGPTIEAVASRDGRQFREVRRRGDERTSLVCGPIPLAGESTIFEPTDFDDGVAVDWWVPSFDGKLVACGVAGNGSENYDVRIVECERAAVVDRIEAVGPAKPFLVAWQPDGAGLYYVESEQTEAGLSKSIRYRDLRDGTDETLHADVDPGVWPRLVTAGDSPHLVASFSEGFDRSDVYRWDPGREAFRPLLVDRDRLFKPRLSGDTAYLLTSDGAENFRIVSVDLPGASTTTEIVPERERAILQDFFLLDGGLAAHYVTEGHSSVEIYPLDGSGREELSFEGFVTVEQVADPAGDGRLVQYESFEHPTRLDIFDGGTRRTVAESRHDVRTTITVEQEYYESADGTAVPTFVVSGADAYRDGTGPAVIRGYGGFRQNLTPTFDPYLIPFLEDGGVYVQPNLRGGGEFGTEWHRAGRRTNKRHTFEDFLAAADHVVERGYAAADRLLAWGRSNGGLTVGAAITMDPDRFVGAICDAPLLDMLRIDQFALGESWVSEYGDPRVEADYRYLGGYSPYHNVDRASYPAVLFETDRNDARVHPSHARKMAARLAARTTSGDPILLSTTGGIGHGDGPSAADRRRKRLDEWSFVYDVLGMAG